MWVRLVRAAHYTFGPVTPVSVREHVQQHSLRDSDMSVFPRWPVNRSVESTLETALRLNLKEKAKFAPGLPMRAWKTTRSTILSEVP